MEDLLPPGAEPGTVPTDLDQSTGLERFEIMGKMQGIDVFDMKPLDASRKGRGSHFHLGDNVEALGNGYWSSGFGKSDGIRWRRNAPVETIAMEKAN